MRELEEKYAAEVMVIGVHSGKYTAERVTERIRDASLRLGAAHPTVNDRQYRIWRSYAVNAWPTLVVVDPRGYVLGQHAGEFEAAQIVPFIDDVIAASTQDGTLDRTPRPFPVDSPVRAPGTLRYPEKVALDDSRIAVADSGHDRVLIGTLDESGRSMRVSRVVGTGSAGFDDGEQASFRSPQGLVFAGDTLYVADAGNHAIRAIDAATGAVRTIAGTGRELRTKADLAAGALSSPWDLAVVGQTLYVAMAGTHQLYTIDPATGAARVHCGNRREDIVDGPQMAAALAQPMGISTDGADEVYFVDSESSAVRRSDVDSHGGVSTYVGTGLFDFGDRDGVGDEVRMQHQQGISLHESGRLLVADSYNDALKWVEPETRRADIWVRGLHEPGGVTCGARYAYVADTNAHRVCVVEYASGDVAELEIIS